MARADRHDLLTAAAIITGCTVAGWLSQRYLETADWNCLPQMTPQPEQYLLDQNDARWFPCHECGDFVPVVDLEPVAVSDSTPEVPEVSVSCYVSLCSSCRHDRRAVHSDE